MSEELKPVNLFIAVSSCRDMSPYFVSSLLGLVYHLGQNGIEGHKLENMSIKVIGNASCLSMSRQANLNEALENGYTHMLMLDDDMIFPPDVVSKLIAHGKPVIGCNYLRKGNGESTAQDMEGKLINSGERTGIQSVYSFGLGVVLIELDAIRHVKAPHFAVLWDNTRNVYWGEDLFFCELLRGSNPPVELFIDSDISREHVAHVGSYAYSYPRATALRVVSDETKAA